MKNFFNGMLFIFLNFRLNIGEHSIGLIPAFVGYYFVFKGIESFNGEVPAFEKIKQLSKIMIVVFAAIYIVDLLAINLGFIYAILGIACLAVNLYVSFQITEGVLYLERTRDIYLEGVDLREKWKVFSIMICAVTVLTFVPIINFIALIAHIACIIMFLVAFNRTKNRGMYLGL